jgi:hypothetical protein
LGFLLLLFASSAHAGETILSWEATTTSSDGTPLTDVAGYMVHYGQTSQNYTSIIDVGNQTSYTLTGLAEGQIDYFAVTAYDSSGNESAFSNEVSITLPSSGLSDTASAMITVTSPPIAKLSPPGQLRFKPL